MSQSLVQCRWDNIPDLYRLRRGLDGQEEERRRYVLLPCSSLLSLTLLFDLCPPLRMTPLPSDSRCQGAQQREEGHSLDDQETQGVKGFEGAPLPRRRRQTLRAAPPAPRVGVRYTTAGDAWHGSRRALRRLEAPVRLHVAGEQVGGLLRGLHNGLQGATISFTFTPPPLHHPSLQWWLKYRDVDVDWWPRTETHPRTPLCNRMCRWR